MGEPYKYALVITTVILPLASTNHSPRVEYPVGLGFSTGNVTATSEEETAADFIAFFKNFLDVFAIKNFKIYVTGESYAGRYVPYVSAAMLDQNDTEHFDLSGVSYKYHSSTAKPKTNVE
jgi:carboxypeptidase C (cathepsin A)